MAAKCDPGRVRACAATWPAVRTPLRCPTCSPTEAPLAKCTPHLPSRQWPTATATTTTHRRCLPVLQDTVDMFQLFKEDGRPAGRAITVADLQRVNDAGSLGLSAAELQVGPRRCCVHVHACRQLCSVDACTLAGVVGSVEPLTASATSRLQSMIDMVDMDESGDVSLEVRAQPLAHWHGLTTCAACPHTRLLVAPPCCLPACCLPAHRSSAPPW